MRFSQEISEDYQLILLERGAHSFVGTFDGHPYVAPFSGNIVELCPVGALTSRAYRFRARPWDIEGAGTVCTLCPAQCNVELTVRDDRVMRVLSRDHEDVDDGWLCDKGRFAYQHTHVDERITEPLVREGTQLMPASWEKALAAASGALKKAGAKTAALAGGETTNEEAFLLQRLFREGLGSGNLSARTGAELPLDAARALADPALQATVSDLEWAHDGAADRLRPDRRRAGVGPAHPQGRAPPRPQRRASPARGRPRWTPTRAAVLRHAPGRRRGAAGGARRRARRATRATSAAAPRTAGTNAKSVRELAKLAKGSDELVIVYGERLLRVAGARPRGLLNIASRLRRRSCSRRPSSTNARGVREAGFAPGHGPGYATLAEPGPRRQRDRRGARLRRHRRASGCTTSIRCARIRTARCGSPRWAPRRP